MQVDTIERLIILLQHATATGVLIYWISESIRNWIGRGSPAERTLREDMQRLHEDLRALIAKLP